MIEFVLAKRTMKRRAQVWEMRERLMKAMKIARWIDVGWYWKAIDGLERAAKVWN